LFCLSFCFPLFELGHVKVTSVLPEHADLEGVCVAYIQEKAQLSQSTISNYMTVLKRAGFVVAERHGQWTFYRRDEENIGLFLEAVQRELLKP
jgi:DNA-binding transcriptional ArsR family regulator